MTQVDKELLVSRIIAGCLKYQIKNEILLIKSPSRYQRYLAEEVFHDAFAEAEARGSYTDNQLTDFLIEHGFWTMEKQRSFESLPKDIEELKIDLFNSAFNTTKRNQIRRNLAIHRKNIENLALERHEYDYLSARGVAFMAKARYLVAASLYDIYDNKVFDENKLWAAPNYIVEEVAGFISKSRLSEGQYRELARTDPWRTVWIARKYESGVFGVPVVDLSDEQRMLSVWSVVYDNIYEHHEAPADDIIGEDDMVDGWMLIEKRKRDAAKANSSVDNMISNERIRSSEEVFIPVGSYDDAKKVLALNDPHANAILKQRMNLIEKKGSVEDQYMPDSQMKIRQQMTQMYMEQVKGNKG